MEVQKLFWGQNQRALDDAYVDGLSITYGHSPKHHVWTFAGARSMDERLTCQCTINGAHSTAPPFIKGEYFCERGILHNTNYNFVEHNPLWDGHGCTDSSTCCEFNNPPWFCQQFPEPTTEDIEIRLMSSAVHEIALEREDTPVELIDIYVQ